MAHYKVVSELYFEAEDVHDAFAKLGEHFTRVSKGEMSHLLKEGSGLAIGEPEFDPAVARARIMEVEEEKSNV